MNFMNHPFGYLCSNPGNLPIVRMGVPRSTRAERRGRYTGDLSFWRHGTTFSVHIQSHTSSLQFIYGSTALVDLGRFFSFLIYRESVWFPGRGSARPKHLFTHRSAQTLTKRTQTSMPWVGFEPTIPVFERAKEVHALDCAATVIG
jgi:hypothetical protein